VPLSELKQVHRETRGVSFCGLVVRSSFRNELDQHALESLCARKGSEPGFPTFNPEMPTFPQMISLGNCWIKLMRRKRWWHPFTENVSSEVSEGMRIISKLYYFIQFVK